MNTKSNIGLIAYLISWDKTISDTRHHHKRPLYFNIPKFDESEDQITISNLSQVCHRKVKDYVNSTEKIKESELLSCIEEELSQIEEIGLKILKSVDSEKIIKEFLYK